MMYFFPDLTILFFIYDENGHYSFLPTAFSSVVSTINLLGSMSWVSLLQELLNIDDSGV